LIATQDACAEALAALALWELVSLQTTPQENNTIKNSIST
jgi:hypothetical protein